MADSLFQSLKLDIVSFVGLSKDALHVYVGLIVFLVTAAAARQGLRSRAPLIAVLVIALLGEVLDIRDHLARHGQWRLGGSIHDLLNTMFWPTALWLLAKYSRVIK
jgi:uncharacterized membrane protein YoaK (UPF0700 family)